MHGYSTEILMKENIKIGQRRTTNDDDGDKRRATEAWGASVALCQSPGMVTEKRGRSHWRNCGRASKLVNDVPDVWSAPQTPTTTMNKGQQRLGGWSLRREGDGGRSRCREIVGRLKISNFGWLQSALPLLAKPPEGLGGSL